MRHIAIIARLAARDWRHERMLSACAVLALASMLTPLLVLYGVRVGLVETLRAALLHDPAALIIIPAGSGGGGFTNELFESLRRRPDVRFITARTRDVAAEMQFVARDGSHVPLTLEPTGHGDPLLERFGQTPPSAAGTSAPEDIVLSSSAAGKLSASKGDILRGRLGRRRPDGALERAAFTARVAGVLPPEAIPSDTAFLPLSTLENIQDYRDYIAVPPRGWDGAPAPGTERRYESFRLYARDLDSVETLDNHLRGLRVNVITKAKNIADIRMIDGSLTRLLMIVALAVGAGFVAFTLSSSLAAVRRKGKMLGMLRLLGFSRPSLLCYPLCQALLTCAGGTFTAWLLAHGVAVSIDSLFAAQLAGGAICVIRPEHFLTALAAGLALSLGATLYPAVRTAGIEPALVIRDV
ncbi:MAG: ABC transporter permease [Desulfovibrio sp.]|jgi:putative ABC transport system permease protein|nr:ABC transporter permease [Desulfovibrio sp.]